MEVEHSRTDDPASMTFDEVLMERSKSFIKALQELKNLRPQLYSSAEYCEKSYLRSEQKQMVPLNLKDYAVRALVNAVDHLGTVAYKLTDLLEQQSVDVSTMELKVSCLNHKLLTCQTYTDKGGLRQQQLLAFIPRHHKHYILPNTSASKTLSWHLASETKSTVKSAPHALLRNEEPKTCGVFQLAYAEESNQKKSSAVHHQLTSGGHVSSPSRQTFVAKRRDSKPLTAFRSLDNPSRHEKIRAPVRNKSVLSAFFTKQKMPKLNT